MASKGQSHRASIAEVLTNTAVGLAIAFVSQAAICYMSGINLSAKDNATIVGGMTVVSIVRQYVIRRFFNRRQVEHG